MVDLAPMFKGGVTPDANPHVCPLSADGSDKDRCVELSGRNPEQNRNNCCGTRRGNLKFEPCNCVHRRCVVCLEEGLRGLKAGRVTNVKDGTCENHDSVVKAPSGSAHIPADPRAKTGKQEAVAFGQHRDALRKKVAAEGGIRPPAGAPKGVRGPSSFVPPPRAPVTIERFGAPDVPVTATPPPSHPQQGVEHEKLLDSEAVKDVVATTTTTDTAASEEPVADAELRQVRKALIRELSVDETTVIHGVAYGWELPQIDAKLKTNTDRTPPKASDILWELYRKFDLLDLGRDDKMRHALGKLYLEELEAQREQGEAAFADPLEDANIESSGRPDGDEDGTGQAGDATQTNKAKDPMVKSPEDNSDAQALARKIEELGPTSRKLAAALAAGDDLKKIAKDLGHDDVKVTGVARSALFKKLGFPAGREMLVEAKVTAIKEAYPLAVFPSSVEGEASAAKAKPPNKPRAASKDKPENKGDAAPVPALVAASAPVAPDKSANGGGHMLGYELPVRIDLTTLGDFTNFDLVATQFGPEHSDARAQQIAEQRKAGFTAAEVVIHPAWNGPHLLFIKRSE